jgi:hypothetical protein
MKIFLKKAWAWIKNYWYVPALLIYTIVLWAVFRKKNERILELFEISKESYQKEIDVINAAHLAEIEKKQKIVESYTEALKKLELEYNIELEKLGKEEKKEVSKLVAKFHDSPDELAEEMKRLFGV